MPSATDRAPRWMRFVLTVAGIYNLTWGFLVVALPVFMFHISGLERPGQPLNYPEVWQCVGMVVGVYGVGYLLASRDPFRHWPLVFVGLVGKVFGPLGVLLAALEGRMPWAAVYLNLTNDFIWWAPFGLILFGAYRAALDQANQPPPEGFAKTVSAACSQDGTTLAELSNRSPTLVVFLRHFGCTFCREALADLAKVRPELKAQGTQLAIVHMSDVEKGKEFLAKYGLGDVPAYSDPDCLLYRAFALRREAVWRFFNWKVWRRGFEATRAGHVQGLLAGDGFRMPGVFLLHHGEVLRAFRHETAGDRPNYQGLACPVDGRAIADHIS